jgi:hypothetical protein
VTGNITSPTITAIQGDVTQNTADIAAFQEDINGKLDTNNPAFTGTMTGTEIYSSTTLDISANNYITLMNGTIFVDPAGEILANVLADNTYTNRIESGGIYCNNLFLSGSFNPPVHPPSAVYARASCTITASSGNYTMSDQSNFRQFASSGTPWVIKNAVGHVSVLVDAASGLNTTNFRVCASGSRTDGTGIGAIIAIAISQKSAYSDGSGTVGYSFKLLFSRVDTSGLVDLAGGLVDIMVFW